MRTVTITIEGLPNTGKVALGEVIRRKLSSLDLRVKMTDLAHDGNHDELWKRTNPENIVMLLKENDIDINVVIKEQKPE